MSRRSSTPCTASWRPPRSRLKLVSPYDVLAEPCQPNLPGTVDQYPNWRLPLPQPLEQLQADPRIARIAALFSPDEGHETSGR